MAEFDTIIKGGTIVDGTGGPAFTGDLALSGGRIAAGGTVGGRADAVAETGGTGPAAGGVGAAGTHG